MRQPLRQAAAAALTLTLAAFAGAQTRDDNAVPAAVAQKQASEIAKGDPSRWYKEDTSEQGRLKILMKEIDAAYQQARLACQKRPASERAACQKDARATWEHDRAHARETVQSTPAAAEVEEVKVEPIKPGATP